MKPDPSRRQLKDAQGRLFWIWAFSIPVAPVPNLTGIAVLVMAAYSTMCYLKGRRRHASR